MATGLTRPERTLAPQLLSDLTNIQKHIAGSLGTKNAAWEGLQRAVEYVDDRTIDPPAPEIETVTITRAEGRHEEVGKALVLRTVEEADAVLAVWAHTAPKPGNGYDKTDVVIHFSDGSEYRCTVCLNAGVGRYITALSPCSVYFSEERARLGRQVWTGPAYYTAWAYNRTQRAHYGFIRAVCHTPGGQDHIITNFANDPLANIVGTKLLAYADA